MDQPEEPFLERRPPRLDGMDTPAGGHDRGDELRDPIRGDGLDRQPVPVVGQRAEPDEAGPDGRFEPGHVDPDGILAEQLFERSGGDDPAGIDDRDPVADELDLGQQMGVQEDRRAASRAPG